MSVMLPNMCELMESCIGSCLLANSMSILQTMVQNENEIYQCLLHIDIFFGSDFSLYSLL